MVYYVENSNECFDSPRRERLTRGGVYVLIMSDQGRKSGGEFDSKITDEDVLAVLEAAETPVLTTRLVAEQLPVTSKAVYYRLRKLNQEGRVDKMKVGARGIVWWVADASK